METGLCVVFLEVSCPAQDELSTMVCSSRVGGHRYKEAGESPLGQLPMLECDGLRLSQTTAIVNYIARKVGAALEGTPGQQYVLPRPLMRFSFA